MNVKFMSTKDHCLFCGTKLQDTLNSAGSKDGVKFCSKECKENYEKQ